MRKIIALLSILSLSPLAFAENAALDTIKGPLFEDTNKVLRQANEARAFLLAPRSYGEGKEHYQKANQLLSREARLDTVQRELEEATVYFRTSMERATVGAEFFAAALRAHDDAVRAETPTHLPEDWDEVAEDFASAAVHLEQNRERSARRVSDRAETDFRELELRAIKINYLDETRKLLEVAKNNRARKLAARSYERATELLHEAETSLTDDRYDTDRPRSLAQEARHQALHAIYAATLARRVDRGEVDLESVLLEWEDSIRRVADLVDVPVHFDFGEAEALEAIAERISGMARVVEEQSAELSDRSSEVAMLRSQVEQLGQELGMEARTLEGVNRELERQQRRRQLVQSIDRLFDEQEAAVLRRGNDIVIRMVGLNFDVGRSDLKAEHGAMLEKLEQAIARFPQSKVVVEGHTDSFGSDEKNQELSLARSQSVYRYLLNRLPISPSAISVVGFGETRPVANNETTEGRKRNRRIDIVITEGDLG